ncbi:MAG: dihydrofolate reductase family protein [Acidobacteria bacterium]|nr:dihydrofolate reductase family protein [Acidobacteriota bacterium]
MEFQPPSELSPFEVLFDLSEPNPTLPEGLVRFAGSFGFPEPPPLELLEDRPWVFANFVQSLDGLVSFGGTRPGGEWIARSRHDRWMMDLLRAHADALICGARSLIREARYGKIPGGPVFRIVDPELLRLREQVLGLGKLKNIIVTGSGKLRPEEYRLFHSEHVEAWIATTPQGRRQLGEAADSRVLITGAENRVDWKVLLHTLRSEHGVRRLLCEGGPTLYGDMVRAGVVDEKFLTISPQEIGAGLPPEMTPAEQQANAGITLRPTSFSGPGFAIETARWYHWISCRRADNHEFNRYRVATSGPPLP